MRHLPGAVSEANGVEDCRLEKICEDQNRRNRQRVRHHDEKIDHLREILHALRAKDGSRETRAFSV